VYSEKVLEHFREPRNVGEIENPDALGDVGNPKCGDMMRITMKINDETERIEDVKFQTFGCGAAIAVSSMLTELIKGRTLTEALEVSNQTVADELGGLPPVKMHCSVLGEQGIATALKDYFSKHPEKQMPANLEDKLAKLDKIDPHGETH
jgi:nitrogen fixation NifU-like protein